MADLTLRALAEKRGLRIGAAVAVRPLREEPQYRQVLAREFNLVTPENAMKLAPLRPARDRWAFEGADEIAAFAAGHGMQVRGHTLVWHNALPPWLTEGAFSRQELAGILQQHIEAVVGRYRGRVAAWDVVNEAVGPEGGLRDTFWARALGPQYLDLAFRWAHQADPGARLFYNDYQAEDLGAKSAAVYELAAGMLDRQVPISGVGLQMHIGLDRYPQPECLAANINRLAALGLQVQITELDVRIQGGTGTREERLAEQARIYRQVMAACLSASGGTAFVMWGFTDRHSWIPWHTGRPDAALIFDESYQPKPAYQALLEALAAP